MITLEILDDTLFHEHSMAAASSAGDSHMAGSQMPSPFMETKGALPCPQQIITGSYPE
jgi:hypothetical protein